MATEQRYHFFRRQGAQIYWLHQNKMTCGFELENAGTFTQADWEEWAEAAGLQREEISDDQ